MSELTVSKSRTEETPVCKLRAESELDTKCKVVDYGLYSVDINYIIKELNKEFNVDIIKNNNDIYNITTTLA